jgi:hypothetical protein
LNISQKSNISIQYNRIDKIIPSFNNELIAFSTDTGYIIVFNADMTRIMHKYQSNEVTSTKYLAW